MGLFFSSREEKNDGNNEAYASGFQQGRESNCVEQFVAQFENVIPKLTDGEMDRDDAWKKGFDEGVRQQQRDKEG